MIPARTSAPITISTIAVDGVLGVLHRRAQLQPDEDDDRTQYDRDEHVGRAGQTRQAGG